MGATEVVQRIDLEPWMRFPADPADARLSGLAEAATQARLLAGERSAWALEANGSLPDAGVIYHECHLARATGSTPIDIHRRDNDGTELVELDRGREPDAADQALRLGGGLVLRDADRISPSLSLWAGWLAVAIGGPVEAVALFGSEPLRHVFAGRGRTWVSTVNSEVIVHEPGRPPIAVEPMSVAECATPPRVLAGAVSFTILLMERVPTPAERARIVAQRAGLHPMLRCDVPTDIDEPLELGAEELRPYLDVFNDELAAAQDSLDAPTVQRAWRLAQTRSPVPVPLGADPLVARGLIPGGVGVVGLLGADGEGGSEPAATAQLLVVAGNCAFAVPGRDIPIVERLVSGEPFEVRLASNAGVAALAFAEAGLAVLERPPDAGRSGPS